MDRVDRGLKPACVTICTTQCLHFGKAEETTQIRRERHARQVSALEPDPHLRQEPNPGQRQSQNRDSDQNRKQG